MKYILLAILFGLIGYYFYKLKPFEFTQNCRPIIESLQEEADSLKKLAVTNESVKQRQEEIKEILSQFYGQLV